ncbi:MAG: hypothetical protein ABJB12_21910 [Pseudomonadota bacterium]
MTRIAVEPGHFAIYVGTGIPALLIQHLPQRLLALNSSVAERLGLSSTPPDVYVYATSAQLREGVCVSPATVAYYDGAIHLALTPHDDAYSELFGSLRHELVHHVLFSHGIRRPVWFQEGAAMIIAEEWHWFSWHPKARLLRPEQMVATFPQTTSAEEANAFYGQAFAMTTFLKSLCRKRKSCSLADLTQALASGAATPETLFDWATRRYGSDLIGTTLLPLWDDFVQNGFELAPATESALQQRSAR